MTLEETLWSHPSSNRPSGREKRVMTPMQFLAASGGHSSKLNPSNSHSRELLFAKHARLESREKLGLRQKKLELDRELHQAHERERILQSKLAEAEKSLKEATAEVDILREAEKIHIQANSNITRMLEEERTSAFNEQMSKVANDSASVETVKAVNTYLADVERKAENLYFVVEKSSSHISTLREKIIQLEKELVEQRQRYEHKHANEMDALKSSHQAELNKLEEELQYLGSICTTMQQVLKKQHVQANIQPSGLQTGVEVCNKKDGNECRTGGIIVPITEKVKKATIAEDGGESNCSESETSSSMIHTPSVSEGDRVSNASSSVEMEQSKQDPKLRNGMTKENAEVENTAQSARYEELQDEHVDVSVKCNLCTSRLRAMHTLGLEAKRLESEVVMLTHDFNTQSYACRELKNASAALVEELNDRELIIKNLQTKNDNLEKTLAGAPVQNMSESHWANMMVVRAFVVLIIAALIWTFSYQSSSVLCIKDPSISPS